MSKKRLIYAKRYLRDNKCYIKKNCNGFDINIVKAQACYNLDKHYIVVLWQSWIFTYSITSVNFFKNK